MNAIVSTYLKSNSQIQNVLKPEKINLYTTKNMKKNLGILLSMKRNMCCININVKMYIDAKNYE